MISISTFTTKTVSNIVFKEIEETKLRDFTARVSRTATLDGGSVITHSGVVDSDRILDIRAQLTEDQADDLQAIFESETLVFLSCRWGLFYGAIDILKISDGDLQLKFLVKDKLND